MTQTFEKAGKGLELLTTQEMGRADALTIEAGTPGLTLMEAAGKAVADAVSDLAPEADQVSVLCGPGNNGGDGFVAARLLRQRGYRVRVALLGHRDALKGDAAHMAGLWDGNVDLLTPEAIAGADIIVDAIFGAGLTRGIEGTVAKTIQAVNDSGLPVVCVDVPSGTDGTNGEMKNCSVEATSTITFFRRKPGHLLLPGRRHCGRVCVADIGISGSVLETIAPQTWANAPGLWRSSFPWASSEGHKYSRGHAVILSGGPEMTGAARLSARGALRVGAGLVTLVGSKAATAVNAAHSTAVMVQSFAGPKGLSNILSDDRKNAVLLGPGAGIGKRTRELVLSALKSNAVVVLDADALTSFEKTPKHLFSAIAKRDVPVVLTPHEGEFSRLFAMVSPSLSKLERARKAAKLSRATVILKGADTVIAHPGGRAAINENAPPWTATAGAGDVLAGYVTGLLAQGMPVFEAASAAVWLHGACAEGFGPGLIAEDISEVLPGVLGALYAQHGPGVEPFNLRMKSPSV